MHLKLVYSASQSGIIPKAINTSIHNIIYILNQNIIKIENNINKNTNKIIEIQKDYSMKIQNLLNTFRNDNLKG